MEADEKYFLTEIVQSVSELQMAVMNISKIVETNAVKTSSLTQQIQNINERLGELEKISQNLTWK